MDETSRKWLSGCAVGCALAVALVVLVIGGAYLGIKKLVRSAQQIDATMDSVTERFGPVAAFHPLRSGELSADRLEAFLDARRRSSAERERLERTLSALAGAGDGEGSWSPRSVAGVRAAVRVTPQMMGYLGRRSQALLEADIGLGEYLYLYTLIYPVWLRTPIDDGPPFIGTGHPERWETWAEGETSGTRRTEVSSRLHRITLPMLRNQLEDLRSDPDADQGWLTALEEEVELMDADPERLPWQDGLPPQTADSLEPFRAPLQASYSALCHPVELAVQQ